MKTPLLFPAIFILLAGALHTSTLAQTPAPHVVQFKAAGLETGELGHLMFAVTCEPPLKSGDTIKLNVRSMDGSATRGLDYIFPESGLDLVLNS